MGKRFPKDRVLGELGKDCLGEGKVTGVIKWERAKPGLYWSKPFRFSVEKETDTHWIMVDARQCGIYHRASAALCKDVAQGLIDVECGKKTVRKPSEPRVKKRKGLFG